uniref:Uncharacterized protein n=1 Tax=Anguilla anguilla TaxID=7936 RepID=A0A0E9QFU5_ANGAN
MLLCFGYYLGAI